MADISKIKINTTTYNVKDSRIPALPGSENTYLRGDGTWAAPSVTTMQTTATIVDEGNGMLVTFTAS